MIIVSSRQVSGLFTILNIGKRITTQACFKYINIS